MESKSKRDRDNKDKSLLKIRNIKSKNSLDIKREYKYKGIFKDTGNENYHDDILLKSGINLKKIKKSKTKIERTDYNDEIKEKITVISLMESLGCACILRLKKIFNRPKKAIMIIYKFIISLLRIAFISASSVFKKLTSNFSLQSKAFFIDLKKARKYIKICRNNPKNTFSELLHYFKKGLKRHKKFFKTLGNALLPITAALAFAFTVKYWNSVTFALEVNYNDKNIGYIEDETIYEEAKEAAESRMNVGRVKNVEIQKPSYELSLVSIDELVDSDVLCDRIIENSKNELVNACGIYIDGEFIGAVKNETDAKSVFDSILEPYEKKYSGDDSFVDFVEKVEYAEGFYPNDENVIWDSSKLIDTLSKKKEEAVKYEVKDGDTIYDIAIANDISVDELLNLNPGKDENLFPGDVLTISKEVNYIRVKVMKTQTRTVPVDFKTEKRSNPSMFKGTEKTVREGAKGEDTIKELVTYIDGVRVSSQEIERKRTKEPVNAKIQVGSRPASVGGSGGGNLSVSVKGFVWPAPACTSISSYFGWRTLFGEPNFHTGIDLIRPGGNSKGAVIVASLGGTVESVRRGSEGYGHNVVINHGGGLKTRYAHCLPGSISVSVGQTVRAGQPIARVGESGLATGPHLHFEVIINGQCVNPLPYIK